MKKEFERFTISQGAILIREGKCLILEFPPSEDKSGSWWGLPGGRIDIGEEAEVAFRREIKEELGIEEFEILELVDADVGYGATTGNPAAMIAYLIKNDNDEIVLSDEHVNMAWIGLDEVDKYQFRWRNGRRAIRRGFAVWANQ